MNTYEEFRDDSPNAVPVHGFLHRSPGTKDDWLVLTHGAGSNCKAPLLVALADHFSASGLTVLRYDLPYRQMRPNGPPPPGSAERDQRGLAAAVAAVRRQSSGRVFLGGHSYGGRQASMLAADQPGLVDGLLLLSYPLHPPQKPAELRTAHFPRLQTPALFVSGNHDGFGSTDELESALKLIPARTELLTVTGAGHELLSKKNRDALPEAVVKTFRRFEEVPSRA
jgi:predicted alpha/beta-hydrolase family hydrolase